MRSLLILIIERGKNFSWDLHLEHYVISLLPFRDKRLKVDYTCSLSSSPCLFNITNWNFFPMTPLNPIFQAPFCQVYSRIGLSNVSTRFCGHICPLSFRATHTPSISPPLLSFPSSCPLPCPLWCSNSKWAQAPLANSKCLTVSPMFPIRTEASPPKTFSCSSLCHSNEEHWNSHLVEVCKYPELSFTIHLGLHRTSNPLLESRRTSKGHSGPISWSAPILSDPSRYLLSLKL